MEINEFYNYTEVPGCSGYQDTFDTHKPEGIYQVETLQTNSTQPCANSMRTGWNPLPLQEKKNYIQQLLNGLEQSSSDARLEAGRQLLYIAQGKVTLSHS